MKQINIKKKHIAWPSTIVNVHSLAQLIKWPIKKWAWSWIIYKYFYIIFNSKQKKKHCVLYSMFYIPQHTYTQHIFLIIETCFNLIHKTKMAIYIKLLYSGAEYRCTRWRSLKLVSLSSCRLLALVWLLACFLVFWSTA